MKERHTVSNPQHAQTHFTLVCCCLGSAVAHAGAVEKDSVIEQCKYHKLCVPSAIKGNRRRANHGIIHLG